MKNNQLSIKNIEQLLLNRKQKIDQEMSAIFQIELEKNIVNKLYSLKSETSNKNKFFSIPKIFEDYLCLLQNIMMKKTLIGLTIGIMLIIAAVWLNFKFQTAEKFVPAPTQQMDSLLTHTDQSFNEVEAAIQNFDNIDENLDNEKTLAMLIDNLIKEVKVTPRSPYTTPASKTANINITGLDILLDEIDVVQSAVNTSISDFDSINEDEDKVII